MDGQSIILYNSFSLLFNLLFFDLEHCEAPAVQVFQ